MESDPLIKYDDRFKLYHLSEYFAWFTTDDPWEHCSAEKVGTGRDPKIPKDSQFEFVKIAWDCPPGVYFSECNVMDCIRGTANWLESIDETTILAGKDISIGKFCGTIIANGGEIWLPLGRQL